MKVLKWIGVVVLVIALVVGGFLAYVAVTGVPSYDTQKIDLKVDITPERVAHGRQLAAGLCMHCHLDPETKLLTGHELLDLPPEFGRAFSRNITQHPEKGIGKWTDGDLAWLLRTGVHPHTGRYLPPWMPKFPNMADEDIHSIIAWLRSDDPLLAASPVDNRESEPTFFAKFLTHVAFKPFDYPTKPIAYPDTTNTVEYGRYLATAVYDCYQCHSADFAKNDPLDPPKSEGFFGGGMPMPDAAGVNVYCANITSHAKSGIGRWTRDQFVHTMATGIRPDGTPLRYPMVRFNILNDHALGSLYDYLMTVPAIDNTVPKPELPTSYASKGEELFVKNGCNSCHGNTGSGIASLMLADRKYPDDSVLVDVIKEQQRYNPDSFMPHFGEILSDADLQLLAAHVRKLCNAGGSVAHN